MDLNFSPEQEEFRAKVQAFLRDNLPPGWGKAGFRPEGMSMTDFLRDWQRRLYEGGFEREIAAQRQPDRPIQLRRP